MNTSIRVLLNQQLPSSPSTMKTWGNLSSEALAYSIKLLQEDFTHPILIVCDTSQAAEQLETQLNFFLEDSAQLFHFPDWETLAYDHFSPHQDIISQRLSCMAQLLNANKGILITSIQSMMQPLPPQRFIQQHALLLKTGQTITPEQLISGFVHAGYHAVHTVQEHGEFVNRGSIVDVFPMGSKQPIRIDFIGDDIDSLRFFDPDTQISNDTLQEITLLPGNEFPLDEDSINLFLDNWHEIFDTQFNNTHESVIYQDVKQGIASPGLEYYLPLFFSEYQNILDYFPTDSLLIFNANSYANGQQYWKEIHQRWEDRRHDRLRPLLPPEKLFFSIENIFAKYKQFSRIQWHTQKQNTPNKQGYIDFPFLTHPDISADNKAEHALEKFKHYLHSTDKRFLLCTYSEGRRVALEELLTHQHIDVTSCSNWTEFISSQQKLTIIAAPVESGFSLDYEKITLISEDLIFGRRVDNYQASPKALPQEVGLRHISELKDNSHVVHIEHGIGLYKGLSTLEIDGQNTELLLIEYADNSKLYVPVSSLHLIHRYQGKNTEHLQLDKLGNDQWQKNKRKAVEKIYDVAVELLQSYAQRETRKGFKYELNETAYEQFSNEFKFTETNDQIKTINSIINDMQADTPMDRLVCGDVGFGKTEVALRAVFIAVHAGKQVAVLVPTTLLAQQHFENFRDRFANWPIKIELLSRFRDAKATRQAKAALENGSADIVIGTHKLLQDNIIFKNLGLMVVDEEHRFGVRQKERIKQIKSNVDILTLTATPIPRTLNMSLHSLRDLSVIMTPPAKRMSVKSFVHSYDKALIKEAILRELLRGGQVFYLHNEVKTMSLCVDQLTELVPEARISFAHGQMREKELERIMADFYHKKSNLLVCSTIIETGIDIPSANTIIIERADKFGLAQLHQLRGRVGRSHHQAYAYFLSPQHGKITKDAKKRLLAIQEASDLGAGFMLAQHDLEIRGAGELLGEEQSGQMQKIGFSLYMELLEETINSIQDGRIFDIDNIVQTGTEVNLNIPALIPEAYLPDPHNRLLLYKRIANAKTNHDLKQLKIEMIDRFGLLCAEINHLFSVTQLKLIATDMGIKKITATEKNIQLIFSKQAKIEPLKLVELVQSDPLHYQLKGSDQLVCQQVNTSAEEKIQATHALLDALL